MHAHVSVCDDRDAPLEREREIESKRERERERERETEREGQIEFVCIAGQRLYQRLSLRQQAKLNFPAKI